jgi:hypothetical protein
MSKAGDEVKTGKRQAKSIWRIISYSFGLSGLILASIVAAPQVLAFPYQARIGATTVYAEAPIDRAAMARGLARADTLLARSPLYDAPVGTRIFLTNGGWRWRLIALNTADAPGFTRPLSDLVSDAVILNRSDIAQDIASNPVRSLSGTIAHERTHIMVRRHLGQLRGIMLPRWISEGYADHIAREPDVNDPALAQWRAMQPDHPVFFYIEARQRVEAALAASGGDVEALLRSTAR